MTTERKQRIEQISNNTPPEGYKLTEAGILPIDWDCVKLSEISLPITQRAGTDKYETLSISAGIGFVNQAKKFGKELSGKQYEKYTVLHKGDFSYNKGNSKKYPQGCIYRLTDRECATVPNVFESFRIESECPEYYGQLFVSGFLNHQLFRLINHGVRDDGLLNLTHKDFYSCFLPVPPISEQKRITKILTAQDKLIECYEKKIEQLKQIKKYYLQNLFPKHGETVPKIRFKGFTEPWEQRKLGDIADIVGGGTPSTQNSDFWDGDIDWYTPVDVADQIYISASERKITQIGYDNSTAKMLPVGTVLFTSRAGIGKTAILRKIGCTNQGFQSIVPHDNELDSYFIFSRTEELKRYAEILGAGSTFVEVSGKQMAKISLMIPKEISEQQKIGSFFSAYDTLFTLTHSKLEEEKKKKKALQQLLLTGIVRVKL